MKSKKARKKFLVCSKKAPGMECFRQAALAFGLQWSDNPQDLGNAVLAIGFRHPEMKIALKDGATLATKFGKFPGSFTSCEKDNQATLFEFCSRINEKAFEFFPKTFILPTQIDKCYEYMEKNKKKRLTMISKPAASSQGDGITLFSSAQTLMNQYKSGWLRRGEYICQRYISNPLLSHGLKFDLRLYVSFVSLDPLCCYICNEGMVRFCTVQYEAPNRRNLNKIYSHLTNYSLNRASRDYVHASNLDDSRATKRTLTTFWRQLATEYPNCDIPLLWQKICDICYASCTAIAPALKAGCDWYPDQNLACGRCFQIMGFDVLVDNKFQPHLLEINSGPSLSTDSIIEVPKDYEPKLHEKICQCPKNHNPHMHCKSSIDQIIKNTVIQGTLSIVLDIDHPTRNTFERLRDTTFDKLNIVNDFVYKIFYRTVSRSNVRWSFRTEMMRVFPSLSVIQFDMCMGRIEVPKFAKGSSPSDLIGLFIHIYQAAREVSKVVHKKGADLEIDHFLYHVLNLTQSSSEKKIVEALLDLE